MNKKNKKTIQGFTLLETLASIAILATVIIGPLTVITGSSAYARQTKDTIIATHLAEESIELLQNQYYSLYLLCKKDPAEPLCAASTGESSGQISWRVFKDRLGYKGSLHPSCYLKKEDGTPDNTVGCTYDSAGMIGSVTSTPVRYFANDPFCPHLVELTRSISEDSAPDGRATTTYHTYVCKGSADEIVVTHPGAATSSAKTFVRSISIEAIPTFESGSRLTQDHDDLRITSTVTYKGVNGVSFPIKVVRFMHPQP